MTEQKKKLLIAPMQPAQQAAARALILAGLEEHWGWLDPQANPDLDELNQHYARGTFLLAWQGGELIGTGALIAESPGIGRIVRMSVAKSARRQGAGTQILHALIQAARDQGYTQIVLETTSTWEAAIQFYLRNGFQITGYDTEDTHFRFDLY